MRQAIALLGAHLAKASFPSKRYLPELSNHCVDIKFAAISSGAPKPPASGPTPSTVSIRRPKSKLWVLALRLAALPR
jgi:hypothetical protein